MILAVVPVVIVGWLISQKATEEARVTLEDQAKNQLIAIQEMKKDQIEAYFQTIRDQVLTFSNDHMIIDAMEKVRNWLIYGNICRMYSNTPREGVNY